MSRFHGLAARRAITATLVASLTLGQLPAPALAETLGVTDDVQLTAPIEDAELEAPDAGGPIGEQTSEEPNTEAPGAGNVEDGALADAVETVDPAAGDDDAPAGETAEDGSAPVAAEPADATSDEGPADEAEARIEVSVAVIGPDANGQDVAWASEGAYRAKEGDTADTAFLALVEQAGLVVDHSTGEYGLSINSITSPFTGEVLAWNPTSQKYWQFFVNGVASDLGPSATPLNEGDRLEWVYSAFGASVPEVPPVTIDPGAERPDWESPWPGFGTGAADGVELPTGEVTDAWTAPLKDPADWKTYISDPIYVGSYLYAVSGSRLLQMDPKTGEVVREGALAASINSIARMVYVDGLIIVPLSGGRLQALTADKLATVWVTPALAPNGGEHQSLTTLTVGDGCVYFGTAVADWSSSSAGALVCVDIKTGEVKWTNESKGAGYYWAGAARVGSYLVIGDDSGTVRVFDSKTGAPVSSVTVGSRVRSTVVAASDGTTAYAVTEDGVLHRFAVVADGTIEQTGSVKFAKSSKCTPVISGGTLIVGGMSESYIETGKYTKAYFGQITVIDAATLEVISSTSTVGGEPFISGKFSAEVMGTPVVSQQGGETYVYFTANCNPGGIYRHRVGFDDIELIFTPDEAHQNFCAASLTVGPDGTIYYINDSGALFAVRGTTVTPEPEPEPTPEPEPKPDPEPGPEPAPGQGAQVDGSAAVDGAKRPAGQVAAGRKPVSKASAKDAEPQATGNEGIDAGDREASTGKDDAEPRAEQDAAGFNPLAIAGVAAGVIGLATAGLYLARARRRD